MDKEELDKILNRMGNDILSLITLARGLGMDYDDLVKALGREGVSQTLKETAGFKDSVDLVVRRKDGSIKDERHVSGRCLTNLAFKEIAGLMLTDVGGTAFDYIGIGTGTTGALATDTVLEAEVKRKAGTGTRVTTTVTDDTAQLVVTFAAADTLSGTHAITESGVLNAAAAGVLLCRQTFAALNINWDAGDSLQITWKVKCAQGA